MLDFGACSTTQGATRGTHTQDAKLNQSHARATPIRTHEFRSFCSGCAQACASEIECRPRDNHATLN